MFTATLLSPKSSGHDSLDAHHQFTVNHSKKKSSASVELRSRLDSSRVVGREERGGRGRGSGLVTATAIDKSAKHWVDAL